MSFENLPPCTCSTPAVGAKQQQKSGPGARLEGALDVVVAVQHDLGLHDGHQPRVLADGGVARQAVGALGHGVRGGAGGDGHHRAPLGEAGTLQGTIGRLVLEGSQWFSSDEV